MQLTSKVNGTLSKSVEVQGFLFLSMYNTSLPTPSIQKGLYIVEVSQLCWHHPFRYNVLVLATLLVLNSYFSGSVGQKSYAVRGSNTLLNDLSWSSYTVTCSTKRATWLRGDKLIMCYAGCQGTLYVTVYGLWMENWYSYGWILWQWILMRCCGQLCYMQWHTDMDKALKAL